MINSSKVYSRCDRCGNRPCWTRHISSHYFQPWQRVAISAIAIAYVINYEMTRRSLI
ncbi:MAG: hypothetical protein IM546_08525 [Pseudanabaena sp. M065S1SP2A07QC]|nr:hypothetical protein [Pseudanabaena sp. M074S1SP2A07QC]MCA6568786.1 hypothetical protein [Pseudanabaena sp. M065S1SP2A07QC]MCA6568819.1 hypothetical protein [Pseudanabaena sp. M065S1SP2A07QC]